MEIIRRILGCLEARLSQPRLRIFRTFYLNFRTLPFRQAVKLPIFIYGGVRFLGLNGKVVIESDNIKTGMIGIGKNFESFSLFDHSGFILLGSNRSRIVFEGPASIGINSKIRVPDGELRLGKYAFIGSNVRIVCNGESIIIGEYTRIAFETVIMNSGFHYVYNMNKHTTARHTRPITIGAYNWIGNRSSVSSGARTKDHTIICAGSLVNKDFTSIDGNNMMLGGSPAKLIATGMCRIFSPAVDERLSEYFRQNPNTDFYEGILFDNAEDIKKEFQ